MDKLILFVIFYLVISLGIGLYAARKVKTASDFANAGRSLPLPIVIATVFATWFGAETVLGIPSVFIEEGMGGIVEDPFGASLCLIFVGLFFAKKLYRLNLLTIGDYYRQRYNRTIEIIVSLCIIISYLGWVSAQITALGLVFNVLSQGVISLSIGMIIGAVIVLAYTLFGGMWSVAFTDAFQMLIIVIGLFFIAWFISNDIGGGIGEIILEAEKKNKFNFFPKFSLPEILAFIGAAVTIMFGSIPQQDVFQRVMSSKTEQISMQGAVIGGILYFIFAFIPIFIVSAGEIIDPNLVSSLIHNDAQKILPSLILKYTPLFAQAMFFGALLSAIMSTASATLLAPSITITENIILQFVKLNDKQLLRTIRVVVVCFTFAVTIFALLTEGMSIYEMIGNSYKVPLVGAFIPLVMGLYWKKSNSAGATISVFGGLASWLIMEIFGSNSIWPPQLVGLIIAFLGMVFGSLIFSKEFKN